MKKLLFLVLITVNWGQSQTISLEPFAVGLSQPIVITNAGDARLFIAEKFGKIKIVNSNGSLEATPFLDIENKVSAVGERGLLGIAFSPNYQESGVFYVHYSNLEGNTVIARYSVSDNPNIANPMEEIIFTVIQPFSNHNGGTISFGPDGYLWIGLGDGGSAGDPDANGQNIQTAFGKILRLEVSSGSSYTIPLDNPFVNENGLDEIWAYGLRNPWKFTFDFTENEVWIADVGQSQVEEINRISIAEAGVNYSWRCYEGEDAYNTSGCVAANEMTFPVATYFHTNGRCSITGGNVYRGTIYPNLQGKYIFADYCTDEIGLLDLENNSITWALDANGIGIATFGEDFNKEMYVAGLFSGTIYKIVDSSLGVEDKENTEEVKVFLNAEKEQLHIQSIEKLNKYYIGNTNGQIVQSGLLISSQPIISITHLPKGVYYIQMEADNKMYSFKFIK